MERFIEYFIAGGDRTKDEPKWMPCALGARRTKRLPGEMRQGPLGEPVPSLALPSRGAVPNVPVRKLLAEADQAKLYLTAISRESLPPSVYWVMERRVVLDVIFKEDWKGESPSAGYISFSK